MRTALPLAMLLAGALAQPGFSQERRPLLEGILRAEDHRAAAASELRYLSEALSSSDTLLVRRAARALGRLERPALAERVVPLLTHPAPGVRLEAVQAIAQAAQGFRGDSIRSDHFGWDAILAALGERVSLERDPGVRGMLALSLGRLPYVNPGEIQHAQEWLLTLGDASAGEGLGDAVRGMESLTRLTVRRVPLSPSLRSRLLELAAAAGSSPRVRRSALGALLAAQAADLPVLDAAMHDRDPLLRRLAQSGVSRLAPGAARERLIEIGLTDSAMLVRYEALRSLGRAGAAACSRILEATDDPVTAVGLLALDLAGTSCGGDSVAIGRLTAELRAGSPAEWHRAAHALLSLARVAPAVAAHALPGATTASVWQLRMYAAHAARVLRDSTALGKLARDTVANVREAALVGLREVSGHLADSLYRAALRATDYQLVLTAAAALAASPDRRSAVTALLQALDRITRNRKDTSRDPRLALLARLRELGGKAQSARLLPYLRDFDPAVADSAAALLTLWTGRTQRAVPRRIPAPEFSLAELEQLRGKQLRFTLASGRSFAVALLVDDAPLTVLRVARLVVRGYYDGRSFHRVVPNFVIQGGSPGANEYAGADRFMRDELGPLSQERGTLGISTRGRDTGDAQLFVNLVDNPRLDYEYTVWGRVVSGLEVVDAVLEGEMIRRVEIR